MTVFEKAGGENTMAAVAAALDAAKAQGMNLVVASTCGGSAKLVVEQAGKIGFSGKIVVVTTAATAASQGKNLFSQELKKQLEGQGIAVVTAAHALSAAERSVSGKFQGAYPIEIMAQTLRIFGHGTKVCVECSVMALDAGVIAFGAPVVALGGSSSGLDTAVIITPSYSSTILDTVIHQHLCKPGLY